MTLRQLGLTGSRMYGTQAQDTNGCGGGCVAEKSNSSSVATVPDSGAGSVRPWPRLVYTSLSRSSGGFKGRLEVQAHTNRHTRRR